MKFLVCNLVYSQLCNIVNIFLENYSISEEERKLNPRSSITLFNVSNYIQTMFGSVSFSIVSTRVAIKYLVIWIAPSLLVSLIADTKLGRQLHASSLTSSFKCYLMILHNNATVSSTYGLYNSFNCSMNTFNILIATSASYVSNVLMLCSF